TSALTGMCWVFVHGAGGIGCSIVVIGVCADAGMNGGGGGANSDMDAAWWSLGYAPMPA
ncbi:hypothetical protein BDR06DRAFT_956762, partial [Suillus hirtellus]